MILVFSLSGLEELVLSEINSPSRTQQTGDSSSVSSFSYRDMMKEAPPANQNKVGGDTAGPSSISGTPEMELTLFINAEPSFSFIH